MTLVKKQAYGISVLRIVLDEERKGKFGNYGVACIKTV
jgi:hypothetical protein